MRTKRFALLLGAAMLLGLCACGGQPDGADSDALTIMGKKSDLAKSYMTSIFSQYEQATGNKLRIIACDDAVFETEAAARFDGGDAPDVLMHFHNADLDRFDLAEDFYPLGGEDWADELTDAARAYCTDGEGRLLGLPFWESSVSGCYYNKTLLDSLGLKPAATQTEFDMLCQALADTGCTPICWPGDGCTWMAQFGLDPVFADDPALLEALNRNEITYADIPAVTDMVQWIADAYASGWFGRDPLETGWDDIGAAMASGEAVMTFIWDTWFYTDLPAGGTYSVDDFALMPVFMGTAPDGTYEGGNLNMMMVNKNSEHRAMALDFLAFCADPAHYNIAFDGISTVSCFTGQTTNIQSRMVTDEAASIAAHQRVSTASTRILGYSAEDVAAALDALLRGATDVPGCVALMDEYRIAAAGRQGVPGFPPPADPAES